jgi:hypothetical protein
MDSSDAEIAASYCQFSSTLKGAEEEGITGF